MTKAGKSLGLVACHAARSGANDHVKHEAPNRWSPRGGAERCLDARVAFRDAWYRRTKKNQAVHRVAA
jgi:hypothetical protein